ncbi:histamine H3 receptor-like [Rana temporaria]|uniref:histamine H3 receptor-like n=1 Tax=Rana temporaria TaxID=8407 RepID=UPI001AAC7786|nr:histamine H3 receptor-like [Rana temporaria]
MSVLYLTGNVTSVFGTNMSFVVDELGVFASQNMMILITVLIIFLILLTILGNSLVIVAFIEDKRLRNRSNFFILNLAICDFVIGAICIPLYVPYVFTGKWILGKFVCKLWLIIDNLMCTASAFNVVLISYDRFLAVTMAVMYRSQQYRHCKTALTMAMVWILSSLLYSPAILFWEYFHSDSNFSEDLCLPAYYYNWHFLLAASSFDFILPLLGISFFNLGLYWNIRTRSRSKLWTAIYQGFSNGEDMHQIPYIIPENRIPNGASNMQDTEINVVRASSPQMRKKHFSKKTKARLENFQRQTSQMRIVKLSQDKKIAKSLFVLVCVFCICWAPYSLLMTTRAACRDYCIASYWYDITFWLLWINSSVNPILYPLCHESFRRAFTKLFYKYVRNA